MFSRLRWLNRSVALAALLLSPGVGGAWLRLTHDCDRAAHAEAAGHQGHQGHHESGSRAPDGQECRCVGTCHTATTVPAPPVLPAVALDVADEPRPFPEPIVRSLRVPHLHPFALPPPMV